MGAVLIMYYKQLSEGYQDRRRFQIMRNVGLELEQIRRAIRSQVLIVFFLPLMAAAMHIAFALPMIMRMFSVLSPHQRGGVPHHHRRVPGPVRPVLRPGVCPHRPGLLPHRVRIKGRPAPPRFGIPRPHPMPPAASG